MNAAASAGAVSAATVRALREETGAGMMECKKALVECGGDIAKAREELRARSTVRAQKIAGRAAGEGRVAFAEADGSGALVCIRCESDFVAREKAFAEFAADVARALCAAGEGEETEDKTESEELPMPGGGSLKEARESLVMKMGENISVGGSAVFRAGAKLFHYVHAGEQIGAMAEMEGASGALGRGVCMHIAAMRPRFLDSGDAPEEEIAREREAGRSQAKRENKRPGVAAKIADGRVRKYLAETALLHQEYIKGEGKTVARTLAESGAAVRRFALLTAGK